MVLKQPIYLQCKILHISSGFWDSNGWSWSWSYCKTPSAGRQKLKTQCIFSLLTEVVKAVENCRNDQNCQHGKKLSKPLNLLKGPKVEQKLVKTFQHGQNLLKHTQPPKHLKLPKRLKPVKTIKTVKRAKIVKLIKTTKMVPTIKASLSKCAKLLKNAATVKTIKM